VRRCIHWELRGKADWVTSNTKRGRHFVSDLTCVEQTPVIRNSMQIVCLEQTSVHCLCYISHSSTSCNHAVTASLACCHTGLPVAGRGRGACGQHPPVDDALVLHGLGLLALFIRCIFNIPTLNRIAWYQNRSCGLKIKSKSIETQNLCFVASLILKHYITLLSITYGVRTLLILGYWILGNTRQYWMVPYLVSGDTFTARDGQYHTHWADTADGATERISNSYVLCQQCSSGQQMTKWAGRGRWNASYRVVSMHDWRQITTWRLLIVVLPLILTLSSSRSYTMLIRLIA